MFRVGAARSSSARRLGAAARRGWHDVCTEGRLGDPASSAPAPWSRYLKLLHERPRTCAAVSTAAAAAVGDGCAQLFAKAGLDTHWAEPEQGRFSSSLQAIYLAGRTPPLIEGAEPELGVFRSARFAAVVGALGGLAGELWYRRLRVPFPGVTYEAALRALLDQAIFAPAVLGGVVGGVSLLASHGDRGYAAYRLRQDWVDSVGSMWLLWGGGIAVNYMAIPPLWQHPFALGLGVLWSAAISLRLHRPTREVRRDEHVGPYLRGDRRWEGAAADRAGAAPTSAG